MSPLDLPKDETPAVTDDTPGADISELLTAGVKTGDGPQDYESLEKELKSFEDSERKRLGIKEEEAEHWHDANPQAFKKEQRDSTTLLVSGLTQAHDMLISGALIGLGYKVKALDCPDYDALRFGKEFGNRGQCNPTYFTVGNLIKHLTHLRDKEKIPVKQIIEENIFVTAGACGPCRFGTYVTEYRKALRDSGFEGFRVLLFQQQGGMKQATGEASGLELGPAFFRALLSALMAGDVLNAIGYRIRPFEVNAGETNRVLEDCKKVLNEAMMKKKSVVVALIKCRNRISKIAVNRLQPKPKVSIIGEFWAMTTEGDGNYKLQSFLESEGAEVDVQLVTAWLLYSLWEHRHDTKNRMMLREEDGGTMGLKGTDGPKKLATLWAAEKVVRGLFGIYAKAIGLGGYHLPDMDEIATISHQYYDNNLRGGEGHMEVGKLIQTTEKKKAHMVISVKPFGCMPSSGVSDGIQSLITARYPDSLFSAIETTGDGAVNVQSRIQMDLFKARQKSEKEFNDVIKQSGLSEEEITKRAKKGKVSKALYYPDHVIAGTGANQILDMVGRRKFEPTKEEAKATAKA